MLFLSKRLKYENKLKSFLMKWYVKKKLTREHRRQDKQRDKNRPTDLMEILVHCTQMYSITPVLTSEPVSMWC